VHKIISETIDIKKIKEIGELSNRFLDQVRIVRQTLINRKWNKKLKNYVRGFMVESFLIDGR
jgi:3-deoxy-D-arabino-heptulosonate 7-phosphate (DAHP) synthase